MICYFNMNKKTKIYKVWQLEKASSVLESICYAIATASNIEEKTTMSAIAFDQTKVVASFIAEKNGLGFDEVDRIYCALYKDLMEHPLKADQIIEEVIEMNAS